MAADASSSKKRKITDLRASVPFCTQTALAAICKEIAEGGLPEQHSRFSIWNEAKQFLEDHSMSMYGPLFQSSQATTLNNEKVAFLFVNCLSLPLASSAKQESSQTFCWTNMPGSLVLLQLPGRLCVIPMKFTLATF